MDAGEEGRLQPVSYYRTGDETGELIWKNQGRDEDLQLANFLPWLECSIDSQAVSERGKVWEKEMRGRGVIRSKLSVGANGERGRVGKEEAAASVLL